MVAFIVSSISIGIILLFGCLGEILTEKAGNLNLGIPGIMCMGTAGGCFGVYLYMNSVEVGATANWLLLFLSAISFSMLFSLFTGFIYSFLTVSLRSNQNITGLAITTFGVGASQFIMDTYVDTSRFAEAAKVFAKFLPLGGSENWFTTIFFSHSVLTYMAIFIGLLCAFILRRTRVGLNLRAVGESPATADAMGINVTKYKYLAICIGSMIAGLGGLYYIMDYLNGSWTNSSTIEAMGWLSIALVVFVIWRPDFAILGAFVFGMCYTAFNFVDGITLAQKQLFKLLPYVVTVIVLVVTSIWGKKNVQPPASLGVNYFREER